MARRWFLLLDRNLDGSAYADRFMLGLEPDRLPYGAEHLTGCDLAWSRPTRGGLAPRVHRALGFDLVHAWRNRRGLGAADVVYCHTEEQYLAAALVLLVSRRRPVKLVGQTIWFWERPGVVARMRRRLLRPLLRRVDVFVHNAWPNLASGRAAVPSGDHHYVPFGVSTGYANAAAGADPERLVIAVGNDEARDWEVLAQAIPSIDADVRVATARGPHQISRELLVRPRGMREMTELYQRASAVVIPTVDNLHASGVTVMLEAAASGVPVVASRTGGLDRYFEDDEVSFVPPGDAVALSTAINALLADTEMRDRYAERLHAKWASSGYTTRAYWQRVIAVVDGREPSAAEQ